MDALAVSIAAGAALPRVTGRHVFRVAFHFGLFQALMPITGWLAGRPLEPYVRAFDHWVAFGVLSLLGAKMLWEARDGAGHVKKGDPTRGWSLLGLSIATSIDALAVGLTLALMGVSIWTPAAVIGVVAGTLSMIGIRFGAQIGSRLGGLADAVGGAALIGIGVKMLWM